MLNQRLKAALAVRGSFVDAENAADIAATKAAACVAQMLASRAEAKLPVNTGIEALAHVSEGAALMVKARASFIEAHKLLADLPYEIGLPPRAAGDASDCPPLDPKGLGANDTSMAA